MAGGRPRHEADRPFTTHFPPLEAAESSITVRFFSSRVGRRVETETFAPYGHGGGGFTVEYTRRVYRESRLLREERFRVRYGVSTSRGSTGGR